MAQLTADAIEGFVGSLLAHKFDDATRIPWFHKEWWDMCVSESKCVAISAPRGHAKSTAITLSYVLASVLFREHEYVLIVSNTNSQSVLFLQDIKKEMQDNKQIQQMFGLQVDNNGELIIKKDTEDDLIIEFLDGHQFRITAKGSEQKLRGMKWGNKRPDLIIGDDMEDDEQVLNRERREKFRRWVYGALLPSLSKNGKFRMVGTILHLDSFLERQMPDENHVYTKIEPLKISMTKKRGAWFVAKYKAHPSLNEFTPRLWSERYDENHFKALYFDYIKQGIQDVYSQEYLNIPIDESTSYFKRSDFHSIKQEDRDTPKHFYITADLAISSRDRADYTVFVVGGVDEKGLLHVVNVIRDRLDGQEIVETMLALQRTYQPELFGVEDTAITKSIGPFLQKEMQLRGTFINLFHLKPNQDKQTRARSIQARMRANGIRFDKNADWYPTFESELIRFPRDRHDDQVDAFAYLGLLIDRMQDAPTAKEIDQQEYEDELEESGYSNETANRVTGY